MKLGFSVGLTYLAFSLWLNAHAVTWHDTDSVTIEWDPVVYSVDEGERLRYMVYMARATDENPTASPILLGPADITKTTVTFNDKGSFYLGVSAILEAQLEGEVWMKVRESEVAWSSDPLAVGGGEPFGFRFYPVLDAPGNLRPAP